MSDLTEFLRARLDEREQAAEAAIAEWTNGYTEDEARAAWGNWRLLGPVGGGAGWHSPLAGTDRHLHLQSPWDVLADLAAKRRILDGMEGDEDFTFLCKLLALPYASHPDYDESWRI